MGKCGGNMGVDIGVHVGLHQNTSATKEGGATVSAKGWGDGALQCDYCNPLKYFIRSSFLHNISIIL